MQEVQAVAGSGTRLYEDAHAEDHTCAHRRTKSETPRWMHAKSRHRSAPARSFSLEPFNGHQAFSVSWWTPYKILHEES